MAFTMSRALLIAVTFTAAFAGGCANPSFLTGCKDPYWLQDSEEAIGTGGVSRQFHTLADRPALEFPGYIIGIEAARAGLVGAPGEGGGGSVTLLTHIVKYGGGVGGDGSEGGVGARDVFNIYREVYAHRYSGTTYPGAHGDVEGEGEGEGKSTAPSLAYKRGLEAISGEFKSSLDSYVTETGATHIFVYAMGAVTHEDHSIESFNDLFGPLLSAAGEEGLLAGEFRPLIIGISWPSRRGADEATMWRCFKKNIGTFETERMAEEAGRVWVGPLLDAIGEVKSKRGVKVVLVGHSYGANLLMSHLGGEPPAQTPADLVVALQGGFDLRHFTNGAYKEAAEQTTIVLTWASGDEVTGRAPFPLSGSGNGGAFARKHPGVFNICAVGTGGLVCDDESAGGKAGRPLIVDASAIIRNGGGGASGHQDIYNMDVARFIIKLVRRYATITN